MGTWSLIIPLADGTTETIDLASLSVTVRDEAGTDLPAITPHAPAASYQSYDVQPRALVLTLSARTRAAGWAALRATLATKLAPDRVPVPQGITLRYAGSARTLDLDVVFVPKSGDLDRDSASLDLRFVAYDPYWRATSDTVASLAVESQLSAAYVLERSTSGVWSALGAGPGGGVNCAVYGSDGKLYVGLNAAPGVKSWDGAAWSTVESGVNGPVYVLIFGPDGKLYVGGSFTLAGGSVTVANVAALSGAVWDALAGGRSGGAVRALAFVVFYGALRLFAGGDFTGRLAEFAGVGWSTVSTGANNTVRALVGIRGYLYVGGDFTVIGGIAFVRVARIAESGLISALGSGLDATVRDLVVLPDGRLVSVGDHYQSGSTIVGGAAVWDGTAWSLLCAIDAGLALSLTTDGYLWIADGGGLFFWNGVLYSQASGVIPTGVVTDLALSAAGKLALVFGASGTSSAAAVTPTTEAGSASVTPIFTVSGPGDLIQLVNYTQGYAIYFRFMTLIAGETLTMDMDAKTFVSSFRGDVRDLIEPGSKFASFRLLPGINAVSLFVYAGTGVASLAYRPRYWSIDGADA